MMLQKFRLTAGQILSNPNARAIFILGTMLVAALVSGAPNDFGGS